MDSTSNTHSFWSYVLRYGLYCIIALSCAVCLTLIISTPAEGITKKQQNAIMQNCTTIKQTIFQLQKVDSRTRTYLGTTYEMVLSRFIVPLNLRLVKNNRPTLPDIQSEFTTMQDQFRSEYTEYMRELETLAAVDCSVHPDEFYGRLQIVREKRANLHQTSETLSKLAEELYMKVATLKDSL